ncbi:hypothetical protein J4442_02615 [Candidatus Woesearchaeota archaeon]|nr:hypothetical protein [Candidatus Woesearchaeota archaeon]
MAKVVNRPSERVIRSIAGEARGTEYTLSGDEIEALLYATSDHGTREALSQDEVDALLAPTDEKLLIDTPEQAEMRRAKLRIMHSNGRNLDDLHADFVIVYRRIRSAYDRGLLSDGEFEGQVNNTVQNYLSDRTIGAEVGMRRDSYLVELGDLSGRYERRKLRKRAYFAIRSQLKEENQSI